MLTSQWFVTQHISHLSGVDLMKMSIKQSCVKLSEYNLSLVYLHQLLACTSKTQNDSILISEKEENVYYFFSKESKL